MKKYLLLICLSTTACDAAQHSLRTADNHLSNGYDKLSDKTSGYLFGRTREPEEPQFQERDSYCYRTQMDILCYNQPQPQMRSRLVAAQRTGHSAPIVANSSNPERESSKIQVSNAPMPNSEDGNAPKALISGF